MNNRALLIGLGVLGVILILCIGAITVGIAGYFLIRDSETTSVQTASVIQQADQVSENQGILVAEVAPESPADRAGLVRGDIIIEINGEEMVDNLAYRAFVENISVGDRVEMRVLHGDEVRQLDLTVEERNGALYLGIETCQFTLGGQKILHPQIGVGVLVTEVIVESPAEDAGLEVGDQIISVSGVEINQENPLDEIIAGYQPGDQILLDVESENGITEEIKVTLGEHPDDTDQAYLGIKYLPAISATFEEQEFYRNLPFGPGFLLPEEQEDWMPFERGFVFPFGLPDGYEYALIVYEVEPDSPAANAGLKRTDLILDLGGKPVQSLDSFVSEIQSLSPGDEIDLKIYRFGENETLDITITLAENPDNPGTTYLGVRVTGISGSSEFDFDQDGESDSSPQHPFFKLNPFRKDSPNFPEEMLPDFLKDWLQREDL